MVMNNVMQIITPVPDSQYLLLSCPVCESDNVAYVQMADSKEWHGMCFDCGHIGDGSVVRHEAQRHWNKGR